MHLYKSPFHFLKHVRRMDCMKNPYMLVERFGTRGPVEAARHG
jgi:hypothetical protein